MWLFLICIGERKNVWSLWWWQCITSSQEGLQARFCQELVNMERSGQNYGCGVHERSMQVDGSSISEWNFLHPRHYGGHRMHEVVEVVLSMHDERNGQRFIMNNQGNAR